MKNKKIIFLSVTILVVNAVSYAKNISPSDLMARSLDYPGLGWMGHVGIATRAMLSPHEMSSLANQVIEILNEPVIGQINTIENFKSRSRYWGSKYGVISYPEQGYKVLVEANNQRLWVREFTTTSDYRIGQANPLTGEIDVTGRWRCDTFVWWAYYSQGVDIAPDKQISSRNMFNFFPYFNEESLLTNSAVSTLAVSTHKSLDEVSTDELNQMSAEEFQAVIDTPLQNPSNYVAPISSYMRFAYDDSLNTIKRGAMIDKITSKVSDIDLVAKLLKLYNLTTSEEVKNKIVSGLMFHVQGELRAHPNSQEHILLKNFFKKLIGKKLNQRCADWATMGFIETHNQDEILQNIEKINTQLEVATHPASITLKYKLAHKSKELQAIYIKSIIDELKKANDSDLDSYFFASLAIGYHGTGKNLLDPDSRKMVIQYLDEVNYKYTANGIKDYPQDIHRSSTAPYYFQLIQNMGERN